MKYRDYLIIPAICMYILFASCAFVLKADNVAYAGGLEEEPAVAAVNPETINWGSGELWYADGERFGESFCVSGSGEYQICFNSADKNRESSDSVSFVVDGMHLKFSCDGQSHDMIFTDEYTAYDTESGMYFVRADYDSLQSQMVSGKFVNSENDRDYYQFGTNGKSSEYFGDQLYRGTWAFDTADSVVVFDYASDSDFHFQMMFDDYGSVCGLQFNDIEYILEL